jgi:hypothetical protein
MTQEEKQLLFKDLFGRLPYGVMAENILNHEIFDLSKYLHCLPVALENFKPYLRPMSSITEEEENEWSGLNIDPLLEAVGKPHTRIEDLMLRAKSQYKPLDWLNEHHFDYRGLIPMGLALEAPEGMYKQ